MSPEVLEKLRQIRIREFPERFWSSVAVLGENDCWEWIGLRSESSHRKGPGYGVVQILDRTIKTHRAAWEISRGPIPEGMLVLHRCDNPPCCNPSHLFLGTQKENTLDCIGKGRFVKMNGSSNGNSKLTEQQASEIKSMKKKGESTSKLARIYGVSRDAIRHIAIGKTWKHLP